MQLTIHFKSEEFGDGLSAQVMQNYFLLCLFVLDPVRDRFGQVKITSGFRTEEHNQLVGGSNTSQHLLGEACDFLCPYAPDGIGEVFDYVNSVLRWKGQTFWYKKRGHVHVALPALGIAERHEIFDK